MEMNFFLDMYKDVWESQDVVRTELDIFSVTGLKGMS